MDPALSSLFPVHQIGADGFSWWVGQIESAKSGDPKNSGRYRVRIVGQHLKDCDATPPDQLPWAQVMMPVTTPFSDGGTSGASVGLKEGNWVIGFYLDNDKQKPIIMGSIGHTAGATKRENVENDPSPGDNCKSFTTFLDSEANPNLHTPQSTSEGRKGDQPKSSTTAEEKGTTKPGEAGLPAAATPGQMPAAFNALFAEESTTNPTGGKVCVEIANPNCGSENDLKGGLTKIIGDMLKATQQSGGNLGTFYVSKVNGELNSYVDHGMQYVNKAVRLVKSFLARVKGEIVKLIRKGVDELVDLILYTEEATKDALGNVNTGPVAPDLGVEPFQPITKKESKIKPIIDTVNDVLDDLGCSMADFTDKIAKWITDLLLGYLMDAYSNAACLVDNVVDGIFNQLISFIENFISTILGPLQEILALLAAPLDIIGNIVAKVLDLLGISCDGPPAKCEKVIKECTDCGTGETEDWLDKLIGEIEDGPLDSTSYVCDEAKNTSAVDSLPPTSVVFVGGTLPDPEGDPNDPETLPEDLIIGYECEDIVVTEGQKATFTITRTGNTLKPSSLTLSILGGSATKGEDYDKVYEGSSIGFAPGATTKEINFETYKDNITEGPENFFIKLEPNMTPEGLEASFPKGKVFSCTINDFDPGSSISPTDPSGNTTTDPIVPPSLTTTAPIALNPSYGSKGFVIPQYDVTTDKQFYKEGETITYYISTENVTNYGPYTYTLEGDIDENDIVGGSLTGTFNLLIDGTATVTIELAADDDLPDAIDNQLENITFYIDNTPAYASAFILPEDDVLVTSPFWSVTSDVNVVAEGETVTFTVETLNIPDGTNFTYKLEGNISKTDIVGYRLESSVDVDAKPLQIIDGKCIIPLQIAADGDEDEDEEYFNFILTSYRDEDGNNIEIEDVSTQVLIQADVLIDDDVVPTFSVTADKLTYQEGQTITYTIATTNIANGTVLQYTLYGPSISKSDFDNGSLFGNFTIINNSAKVYVGISDDTEIEDDETVTFLVNGTNAFTDVVILGDTQEVEPVIFNPKKPCFDKPIAGKPITDAKGSIISIPILEQGCPYVFPPKVIITGPGYGASAIALLDDKGKVSEVRVTRVGAGYNVNQDPELRCVIDSYTLLSPGQGYTSTPEVYVDGVAGRAIAIIDEQGYVISVQPTDRTSTWNEIPRVRIIGGGGAGARALPSVTCLDNKAYEDQGYAKIGTGKYIDCP